MPKAKTTEPVKAPRRGRPPKPKTEAERIEQEAHRGLTTKEREALDFTASQIEAEEEESEKQSKLSREEILRKARAELKRRKEIQKKELPPWKRNYAAEADVEREYAVAEWWNNMVETNNQAFLPLFFCEARYLVLMGGAGSGKSIFAGRKILERCTTEKGHRILVCRKVARTLRDSCFAQLCGQLNQYYPQIKWTSNKGDLVINIEDTESTIIFAGLDDPEKLKSIYRITSIWIEEASELDEEDFLELDRRLRDKSDYYQQIIISFNPISIMHWLKRRFFDTPNPDVVTHRSTYKDNRFLSEANAKVLEAYKDTDPYHYAVYCMGEWGVTGKTVFNGAAIKAQLDLNIQPKIEGAFDYDYDGLRISECRLEDTGYGALRIYKEPEPGVPYVIGADTSGDGSDFFVAQVLDNRTGEQVAVLRAQYDEDEFARQVYCLGIYYNEALIGVEVNFSTHPVKELERLGYRNQYVREVEDDFRGRMRHSYGFRTDRQTRPVMIAQLVTEARDHMENIVDRDTLEEMQTFVRNEDMKAEAEMGAHDDCVMSLAIAHYIRPQQTKEVNQSGGTPRKKRIKWSEDMIEDWYSATSEQRLSMQALWGDPVFD